jgi:hypothetical protein
MNKDFALLSTVGPLKIKIVAYSFLDPDSPIHTTQGDLGIHSVDATA